MGIYTGNIVDDIKSHPPKYLYHGTASVFVVDILAKGLIPSRERKWDMQVDDIFTDYNPMKDDPDGYVYVTPALDLAEAFAKARVAYLTTKPGDLLSLFGGMMEALKNKTAPFIPDAKPVVVRIDVTPELLQHVEDDPRAPRALRIPGTIQPSMIHLTHALRSYHEQPTR
jgi:hypothetical protein